MERSKNQALYKFLPGMWVSEGSESGTALTSKIVSWNYRKMEGVYQSYIEGEIKRQISLFVSKGGDGSSFDLHSQNTFCIVEPNSSADQMGPVIFGTISPLFFYCSLCGNAFMKKSSKEVPYGKWACPNCSRNTIKQLQMVYTCECGASEPIHLPYVVGTPSQWKYRPNENPYRINYSVNGVEKTAQFVYKCRNCGNSITPDNATAGRNYIPLPVRMINLVRSESGKFFDKGTNAHKTIVARWFGKITEQAFEQILSDSDYAFDPRHSLQAKKNQIENQVRDLISANLVTADMFDAVVTRLLDKELEEPGDFSVDQCTIACDSFFPEKRSEGEAVYNAWLESFAFRLMQYYTIKDSKKMITLENAINRQKELDLIDDESQIIEMNRKLGIRYAQVSCDSQIINCIYGFTRKTEDPKKNKNSYCPRLKLNSFGKDDNGRAIVFSSKLDTEGLLLEIDQGKILLWLLANGIISDVQMPDIDDDTSIKKWFACNIHSESISSFAEIDGDNVTAAVFSLLHSISHAFITAAGEICGLSGNSLSEIVFVETASIFIYAQTSQGIPLGAISGMFECRYYQLLRNVFKESRNCVFDPICEERDDSACSGCMIIPDTSCNSFNKMLGRKFLYSLPKVEEIHTGFWEM